MFYCTSHCTLQCKLSQPRLHHGHGIHVQLAALLSKQTKLTTELELEDGDIAIQVRAMDDYYSLPVLYSLGLNAHLGFLCRLINETIISPTSDLLPIRSDHFKKIELTCDDVVPVLEVCIPWLCLFAIGLSLLLLYSAYYQYVMVKNPKVVCHDPGRMEDLKKHCPVFFEKYRLTPWAPNAYMQSIIRVAIQTFPKEKRRRSEVQMFMLSFSDQL